MVGRKPAEGTPLLPPAEFMEWAKANRGATAATVKEMAAHLKHHGTSHKNAFVTPERWLAQSYYKGEDGAFGPYSVEQLFDMYGQQEEPPAEEPAAEAEKKEAAPPPPAPPKARKRSSKAKEKPKE